jgi:hypothetical protein
VYFVSEVNLHVQNEGIMPSTNNSGGRPRGIKGPAGMIFLFTPEFKIAFPQKWVRIAQLVSAMGQ